MSRINSNFFACFKPVVDDDQPSFVSSPPSEDKSGGGRRRKAVTRTFSRAMKAVFFKTSLVKKIRIRKSRQEDYRSSGNLSSSKHEKLINKMKMNSSYQEFSDTEGIFRTNSNRSSLFTSTTSPSSASSVSSNSRSGSKRIKESTSLDDLKQINRKNRKQNGGSKRIYNSTNGMYIIFVCLVAVVFLGKAFAIAACTSTWLFLAPCSRRRSEVVESPIKEVVDLKEHKKRVIMEGLLDRNRPRVVSLNF